MPRRCSVCAHPDRADIDSALVSGEPYRSIAKRFGASESAVYRHQQDHLPTRLAKAKEAEEVSKADDLLRQLKALQGKTLSLLLKAESAGDLRTALAGIREARGNLELLAKLYGELDERPQVNLYLAPEWLEVRALIVGALEPHEEARESVLRALEGAEHAAH